MSLELAWAAGFFDGEGCTHLTTEGYLSMSIAQCDPEVLMRFQAAVGVGTLSGPYPGRRKEWRAQWWWRCMSSETEAVAAQLWPYLGSVKQEQYERIKATARMAHRREFCRRDLHEMTGANLTPDGRCRECRNEAHRASWRRRHPVAP